MAIKAFYSSSLLYTGDMALGRAEPANEILSPMAQNFILKQWLKADILAPHGGLITE